MSNTWDAEIATLAPDHYWKLDEASGLYLDTGSVATLDMAESIALAPWRQAPSIAIRGAPRQYALWGSMSNGPSAERTATGIQVAGHTTGTFMAVIFCYSLAELGYPILQTLLNNSGVFIGLRINLDGSVEFRAQRTGANFSTAITAAGVITSMTPHLLVGVQRADATGFHIFVDGVDVTSSATQGGTVGVDDYVDQIFSGDAPTDLTIGAEPPGTSSVGGYVYGSPGIWVNTALSDLQVASLFSSIGGFDQDPTDWFDYVVQTLDGDCRWWWPGWYDPVASLRAAGFVQDAAEVDQMVGSGFTVAPSADNVADSGGVGEQRITAYNGVHQLVGSNNPSISNNAPTGQIDSINDFTGTINCLVKITSAPVGITHNFFAFGNGVGNDNMLFSIVGSVFGWSVKLRMEATSGDFWQGVGNGFIFADADVHMLTFVQDGTGVRFYVDGSDESFFVTSSGATIDDETWLSDMDLLGVPGMAQSGEPASPSVNAFDPNQLHDMFVTRTILTALQVSQLWDAVSAVFPSEFAFGAFANELQNTGNGGLPEGPGPDWWWRMNVAGAPIADIGIAQNRGVSPINADSIVEGGDPLFRVSGPLPEDAGNFSVFFDGVGDYFEIGVNGVTGELVDVSTGTIGCFFSRNALVDENIIYAQSNDAGTAFWRWGLNGTAVEVIVQTSVGNRVTLTSSVQLSTNAFGFLVVTCDGSVYRLYIDGVEDTGASVVAIGTGAEGDWFDAFTADNSAVASEADVGFTTETTGRISELFIYDGDVLSATTIAALYEAAISDGITGSPAAAGLVIFENVTFQNGALSDIRASNAQPSTFQQVLRGTRCKFLGGQQGDGITEPQCVLLEGPAQVQFRGCEADLQATPVFGRGGIVGSALDTTLVATRDGSIIVSDCDFDSMGLLDGSTFLSPVMILAAFGMTVEDSRFNNCLGSAIGWRADAQRVQVINNQIEGTTQALGAIYAAQGLNARLGNAWLIRGNKGIGTVGPAINLNGASSAGGTSFARNIAIQQNELDNNLSGSAIRVNQVGDCLIEKNKGDGCTFGVELGEIAGRVAVLRNEIDNASMTAYFAGEATLQLADVTMDRNIADGASVGDGLLITQVRRAYITNNQLSNMDDAVGIGEIAIEGTFDGNSIVAAATPFQFLAATTRVAFDIGINRIESLGNANQITVSTDTIEVNAHYHTITASAPIDLDTIDGPLVEGFTLILRRGLFSSDITLRDGIDNLNLGSDFLMDVDNDQIWLVRQGANWNQLQRVQAL